MTSGRNISSLASLLPSYNIVNFFKYKMSKLIVGFVSLSILLNSDNSTFGCFYILISILASSIYIYIYIQIKVCICLHRFEIVRLREMILQYIGSPYILGAYTCLTYVGPLQMSNSEEYYFCFIYLLKIPS